MSAFEETLLKWKEPIEVPNDYRIKTSVDMSNLLARKKNLLPPLDKNIPHMTEFWMVCSLSQDLKRTARKTISLFLLKIPRERERDAQMKERQAM